MLYFGDCLVALDRLESESIDLVVTDPPYGTAYKTNHRKDKTHRFNQEILNDADTSIIEKVMPHLHRVMKDNTALYLFCNQDKIEEIKPLVANYFNIKNLIVWVKNNWTAGDLQAQYGKQYEFIIYANKGRRKINGRRDPDVWFHNRVVGNSQLHQNQKPLDLIERIIVKSSDAGQTVLDPFMGSGTTAVAALSTRRNWIGCEADEGYFEVAKQRIAGAYSQLELPLDTFLETKARSTDGTSEEVVG